MRFGAPAISGPIYAAPVSLRPPCLSPSTIVDFDFDTLRHTAVAALPVANRFNNLLGCQGMWLWQACCDIQIWQNSNVFKISIVDTRLRRTLVVEGTLVGPWIAELGTTWRNASHDLDRRKLVIDLRNLSVISREGEEAIFDLIKKGAKFTCGGVLTRYVLKQLARKKQQGSLSR